MSGVEQSEARRAHVEEWALDGQLRAGLRTAHSPEHEMAPHRAARRRIEHRARRVVEVRAC